MRIGFIGCVEFSRHALDQVFCIAGAQVTGVVTKTKSTINSDFCDLTSIAEEHDTPVFHFDGNNHGSMGTFLRYVQPDVIYCFGWSHLIGGEILKIPKLGIIGFHPAYLPQNRGRHPLIWALALGLKVTASTFFFMDAGADSGDILSQEIIAIDDNENALGLYTKVTAVALKQITQFTSELASGNCRRTPQDASQASYWRKRSMKDGELDWRMTSRGIFNLVRALSHPYVGAHILIQGKPHSIWSARIEKAIVPSNAEPGRVLEVFGTEILVKCGEGAIWLVDHELPTVPEVGGYL